MSDHKNPSAIKIGKVSIPEPCAVPWEEMDSAENGNKFCQQCKKVVYDLTGKTEKEIIALKKANKGALCGNFLLSDDGKPILAQQKFKNEPKPVYFRHFAAAASLSLIYFTPQAKPIAKVETASYISGGGPTKSKTVEKEGTNTIVTGVIVDQDSNLIRNDLVMVIYANKKEIATVQSSHGLFFANLGERLNPQDNVQIIIRPQNFNLGDKYEEEKYSSASASIALKDAQNLTMKIAVVRPKYRFRRGGAVF